MRLTPIFSKWLLVVLQTCPLATCCTTWRYLTKALDPRRDSRGVKPAIADNGDPDRSQIDSNLSKGDGEEEEASDSRADE